MSLSLWQMDEQRILGLARQFDFSIKLTHPDAYQDFREGKGYFLPTYVHEWTHYLQLLTTSLGNLIAETERILHFAKKKLLYQVSGATKGELLLPVSALIDTNPAIHQEGDITESLRAIRQLDERMNVLTASWSLLVRDEEFDPTTLRTHRPFELDPDAQVLVFKTASGKSIPLPITGLQILEHAAKANELLMNQGVVRVKELSSSMFDYYGLFLFLVQEGKLNLVKLDSNYFRIELASGPNPLARMVGALVTMYTCCQIGLMLYGNDDSAEVSSVSSDEFDPEFARYCMRNSGRTFCRLLRAFEHVSETLDDLRRGTLEERIEYVCASVNAPSYGGMVRRQLQRAEDAQKLVDVAREREATSRRNKSRERLLSNIFEADSNDASKISMGDIFNKMFLERSTIALSVLARNPEASINPVMHADGLPLPYSLFETDEGARRAVIGLPGQQNPAVFEMPKWLISFFMEDSMLVDKILLDDNLACYRNGTTEEQARSTRASFGCNHFEECYRTSKTSHLGFCQHADWVRIASGQYERIKEVGPVWEQLKEK